MKIWLGISGFQYPEWKGKFYPEKLSTARMLTYYAERLSSTEINYTFRSLPTANTVARWVDETPADFRFALKAPQRVTHFAKLKECGEIMSVFAQACANLGAKLGPVLYQLPPTFKADAPRLADFLASLPPGLRAAFEFRHASWHTDEVFSILRQHRAALCLAESEDGMTPREVTADFGYLRLRRTDYSAADLAGWAAFLQAQAGHWQDAFVYFRHEETCVGPGFAAGLKAELGGE
ncbi:MAG: DUF72 domain-containing protein [Verrucomicrobia bacterium]|nr:DUF72 domain-containing protein [Verrucomicrobiota bacterium]